MRYLLILLLLLPVTHALPAADLWNVAVDVGTTRSRPGIGGASFEVYRLGLQRELAKPLWTGENKRLGGYFEASVNHWSGGGSDLNAVAFSPVLALYFDNRVGSFTPYIEAGAGGALLSETEMAGRDLSTAFQFELRFGAGLRSERLDFHVRWMHYSNGSIEQPNHGVDAFVAGIAVGF